MTFSAGRTPVLLISKISGCSLPSTPVGFMRTASSSDAAGVPAEGCGLCDCGTNGSGRLPMSVASVSRFVGGRAAGGSGVHPALGSGCSAAQSVRSRFGATASESSGSSIIGFVGPSGIHPPNESAGCGVATEADGEPSGTHGCGPTIGRLLEGGAPAGGPVIRGPERWRTGSRWYVSTPNGCGSNGAVSYGSSAAKS